MISVSNIAWETNLDKKVAKTLNNYNISYIDIVPNKYFKIPSNTSIEKILDIKNFWNKKGIKAYGMQSLLFGTKNLNIFGSSLTQDKLLEHLSHICKVGNTIGAKKLVFGSPKNRDRSLLDDRQTLLTARSFFTKLGTIAQFQGVTICLEPNPKVYQSNFMTTSIDTAEIVMEVNHPNIRMQLDIGAMNINNEIPMDIIKIVAPIIDHIHISEPHLTPLNSRDDYHKKASEAIKTYLPNMPLTIEMLTSNPSSSIDQIERSIEFVYEIYGDI